MVLRIDDRGPLRQSERQSERAAPDLHIPTMLTLLGRARPYRRLRAAFSGRRERQCQRTCLEELVV